MKNAVHEVEVSAGKNQGNIRFSLRFQNTDTMNAFDLLSTLTKGKINPFGKKKI